MKASTIVGAIIAIGVLGVGVWFLTQNKTVQPAADNTTAVQPSPAPTSSNSDPLTSSPMPPAAPTQVLTASSNDALGKFLTAPNNMTLYIYTKDTPGVSTCYGQCATNWPPYIVNSSATLTAAATINGKMSTTTRTDGTTQLTYNGMPLYYWYKDTKPGDTTGQNVGGVWFVVKP